LVSHETSRFPNKECLHMPGSPTTPGRRGARDSAPLRVAFRVSDGVGTRNIVLFVAQWLACALPCQRFTYGLTTARACIGADVDRCSFIVMDSHHQLFAGLPAHPTPDLPALTPERGGSTWSRHSSRAI